MVVIDEDKFLSSRNNKKMDDSFRSVGGYIHEVQLPRYIPGYLWSDVTSTVNRTC